MPLRLTIRNVEFQLDVHSELEEKFYPVWKQYVSQLAMTDDMPGAPLVNGSEIKNINDKVRVLMGTAEQERRNSHD